MNYRDEVFLKVAETLSFTKAAEILCISQPAVSKHIHLMEQATGIPLFHRDGNRISLSKAGEMTYAALIEIRSLYQNLHYNLGLLEGKQQGELHLGASTTIAQYVIPSIIAQFSESYPHIQIDLVSGNSEEIEQRLIEGKIDCALVENDTSQRQLSYEPFMDDEIMMITAASNKKLLVMPKDRFSIYSIPMVLREEGSGTLEIIRHYFIKEGVDMTKLDVKMHLGSTEAIKRFQCAFKGVSFLSYRSIEKELMNGELVALQFLDKPISRSFRFVIRHGTSSQLVELFRSFMFRQLHLKKKS